MSGPSGSTPILALPYPVTGDSADVPRDIKALADQLDGLVHPVVNPPLVTSLPGVPADGQEVYYRTPVGATWHLRYDAGLHTADGYGWTVLGAPALSSETAGAATRASTGYGDLSDGPNLPQLTLPLPGLYDISYGAYLRCNVAGGTALMAPGGGGMISADAFSCQFDSSGVNHGGSVASKGTARLLTAGLLTCNYRASVNTVTASRRWLTVEPLRLKS
jgi:hypothetical protein